MARKAIVRKIVGESPASGSEENGAGSGAPVTALRALSDDAIELWARILMAAFEADPHRHDEGNKGLGLAICVLSGAALAAALFLDVLSK